MKWICFSIDSPASLQQGHVGSSGGTEYASMTLWLWWEMLHVGNYSWQPLSKASGILNICDCMGRSHTGLCALQGHSCGEAKPLQPLISACSPLRKNNNKLLAFCLYGTWLLCVLISGLATGAALTHGFKNTAAVASGQSFDSREFSPPHFSLYPPLIEKCVSYKETC